MINLMYAVNDKGFDGVLCSILSVVKYHKKPLNVYILTMDYREKNPTWTSFSEEHKNILLEILHKTNKESQIFVVDTREIYERTLLDGKNQATSYTPYCMLRLFADQVEGIPDKVLYFDYDAVACNDIEELWNIDITNYEFAGAKDYYGRFFIGRNYLNSGVLLINMKRVKETNLFVRCLELLKVKKLVLPDQSALNKLVKDKLIIPMKYNEQHKVHPDTVVRHFSAAIKWFPIIKKRNIKLWHIDKVHKILKCNDFDDILEEYLRIKEQDNKRLANQQSQD